MKVLNEIHGDCEHQILREPNIRRRNHMSTWWNDLSKIGFITMKIGLDFACTCCFKLVEGTSIPFLSGSLIGDQSLTNGYPALYQGSKLKGDYVTKMGAWHNGKWIWGDMGIPIQL